VYKRHTPFAISTHEQVIQGDRKIVIDKVGDVLLYAYMYSDDENFDWKSIRSIEMYIGGALINAWDTEYIIELQTKYIDGTYSKFMYDESFHFLPIPVPVLPIKNLKWHNVEFIINWLRNPRTVRFYTTFAFVDEDLPPTDILIQQVKRYTVENEKPIKMNGLVKCIMSTDMKQPTSINLNGIDITVPPIEISSYYHTKYGETSQSVYSYVDILDNTAPKTVQNVNGKIYIFSSVDATMRIFDTGGYFKNRENYEIVPTVVDDVWKSCTDGTVIIAAGISGRVMKVIGRETQIFGTVPFDVIGIHYCDGYVYIIGKHYWKKTHIEIWDNSDPLYFGNNPPNGFDSSILALSSPAFSEPVVVAFDTLDAGVLVIYLSSGTTQYIPNMLITDVGSYDNYSSSIKVGEYTYYAPGVENSIRINDSVYPLITPEQRYMSMVYDGLYYVYIYGETHVIRVNVKDVKRSTMFVPFCINSQSTESSGFLNFDNIPNVVFRGTGNGTMYRVSYNFLRVQNGMAGLLYAY
jgi:hypothetical protein